MRRCWHRCDCRIVAICGPNLAVVDHYATKIYGQRALSQYGSLSKNGSLDFSADNNLSSRFDICGRTCRNLNRGFATISRRLQNTVQECQLISLADKNPNAYMTVLPSSCTISPFVTMASDRSTIPVPSEIGSVKTGLEVDMVLVWMNTVDGELVKSDELGLTVDKEVDTKPLHRG